MVIATKLENCNSDCGLSVGIGRSLGCVVRDKLLSENSATELLHLHNYVEACYGAIARLSVCFLC